MLALQTAANIIQNTELEESEIAQNFDPTLTESEEILWLII